MEVVAAKFPKCLIVSGVLFYLELENQRFIVLPQVLLVPVILTKSLQYMGWLGPLGCLQVFVHKF